MSAKQKCADQLTNRSKMSTPQHCITFSLACGAVGIPVEWSVVFGLVAGINDIVAYPDHLRAMWNAKKNQSPFWYLERNYGRWYRVFHDRFKWGMVAVFPVGVHWAIDKAWHKKGGGWHVWGYYAEAALWIVEIIAVVA